MSDFRQIPINRRGSNGKREVVAWAKVSPEDFEKVSQYSWSFAGRGYARAGVRQDGKRVTVYMHRLVCETDQQVDHINGDKLDNRRENLREATNSQNHAGYTRRPPGKSGERGVYLDRRRGTYIARVVKEGEAFTKTGFRTIEEAVAWRNSKGIELHGDHYFTSAAMKMREKG